MKWPDLTKLSRLSEFFEGDDGKFSMRVVCTYVVTLTLCVGIFICLNRNMPDGGTAIALAGILSTMIGVIYGVGKYVDGSVTRAGMPQPIQTIIPAAPTTINVAPAKTDKVNDANITAQGDVNVSSAKPKKGKK